MQKLTVALLVEKFTKFYVTQKFSITLYPEPDESNPHHLTKYP